MPLRVEAILFNAIAVNVYSMPPQSLALLFRCQSAPCYSVSMQYFACPYSALQCSALAAPFLTIQCRCGDSPRKAMPSLCETIRCPRISSPSISIALRCHASPLPSCSIQCHRCSNQCDSIAILSTSMLFLCLVILSNSQAKLRYSMPLLRPPC